MEFIDNVGHVFSLKSYEDNPIGEKYNEQDYIFWIKEDQISINNYYILPIKFLVDLDTFKITNEEDFKISIESDSLFFKLIGCKTIQEKIENTTDLRDCIFFNNFGDENQNDFKSVLTEKDFYYYFNNPVLGTSFEDNIIGTYQGKSYIIFPFYIIGYSRLEGTFLSNIMIKVSVGEESTTLITEPYTAELNKAKYFNQIIQKSFSDINVYYYGENGTDPKQLIYTIKSKYNDEGNYEILYPELDPEKLEEEKNKKFKSYIGAGVENGKILSSLDTNEEKTDQSGRVHNFVKDKAFPSDVYHYIQKIKQDDIQINKYKNNSFLPPGYYSFEGQIYDGCEYCGSILAINHDGYYPGLSTDTSDQTRQYSQYIYDNKPDNDKSIKVMRFTKLNPYYGHLAQQKNENGTIGGYVIKSSEKIHVDTQIWDFWFDIDNNQLIEAANGKNEITIIESKYLPITYYTPITVGATFINECEELIINGQNMGIRLPKEIIQAFYQSSIYNNTADEKIYKDKIKELLLNYMSIKGECGNFKSMLNSLKWFGWNNKVEISKLIKTDNEFQSQYILDYFDIDTDIKSTFKFFKDTNLIDLSINENQETGNIYPQDFSELPQYDGFIGEGNPELEDLFDKIVEVQHEHLTFYKPYYDFNMQELALKLDCLAYYYQTYFLPIHIKINRASIERVVYANHIKMTSFATTKITPSSLFISNDNVYVEFPESHELLYYKTKHLIDKNYNEFSNYLPEYDDEDLYSINENNIFVPIKIINVNKRYTQYKNGEYILIIDEDEIEENENKELYLIKPDIFLKKEGDEYIKSDLQNATHYQITKYHEIEELNNDNRYVNISSDYFNCNLILSYTYKVNYKDLYKEYQDKYNDPFIENIIREDGYIAYVYIDGKYICAEKTTIGLNDIKTKEFKFLNRFGYQDKFGNYIEYNGKLTFINDKDIYWIKYGILINQKFNYYQSPDQYYMNLVLVPRIFKENIDWLKCEFKISMLVNNKWFEYIFTIKAPNLYVQLGKLKYQYYLKDDNTRFKQIKKIANNKIYFNSFIYQPSLVTIDTLFKDDNDNILSLFEKLHNINEESQIRYETQVELDYPDKYIKEELTQNDWRVLQQDMDNELYQEMFNKIINKDNTNNIIEFSGECTYTDKKYTLLKFAFFENNNIQIELKDNDTNDIITYKNAKYLINNDEYHCIEIFKDENDYNQYNILFRFTTWSVDYLTSSWPYNKKDNVHFQIIINNKNGEDSDFGGSAHFYFNNINKNYRDELVDLKKIYDHKLFGQFYDNYYRGKISIPYNKNFYNRIHLFELYSENDILLLSYLQNNVENISYILFSCYDSGLSVLLGEEFTYIDNDILEEFTSRVTFNPENHLDDIITIIDRYITIYYDDNYNDNYKLKSIRICFKDKKYKTIYPIYKDNNIYTEYYSQIEYNPEDEETQYILYQALFNENGNPNITLNESVDYDMYLMHDKYETYSIIEANEYNLKLEDAIQYDQITLSIPGINYTQEEIDAAKEGDDAHGKTIEDYKIEPKVQATKKDIDEYNRFLPNAIQPGDLKNPCYWYIVFISRYPIYYYSDENLKIHHDEYSIGTYKIKYSRNSLDKFLVNRMNIKLSNGMNHFNPDDMIIVSILNNNQYFNIDLHNKWQITHINDYTQNIKLESNTNTMIIHNNNFNQLYQPGYYNILLNYTIDGMNNYQYETKVRFRVNKTDKDNIYPLRGDENDLLEYEIHHIE